jgi:hypothetical protein
MKTNIRAGTADLCGRDVELFETAYNAWDHMIDHVLGRRGNREEEGWRLLIAELDRELAAVGVVELRSLASLGRVESPPTTLRLVFHAYLTLAVKAAEQAVERKWHWEEKPGAEGRWKAFSTWGILTYLDEDYLRTAFLPTVLATGQVGGLVTTPYDLFQACLERVRRKYNRAVDTGRVESVADELIDLFSSGLDEDAWKRAR